jgi:hypothetical protein
VATCDDEHDRADGRLGGAQFHLFDESRQRMLFSSVPVWIDGALAEYEKHDARLSVTDPRRWMVEGASPGERRFDHDLFDAKFMSRCEVCQLMMRDDPGHMAGAKLASHDRVVAALRHHAYAAGGRLRGSGVPPSRTALERSRARSRPGP